MATDKCIVEMWLNDCMYVIKNMKNILPPNLCKKRNKINKRNKDFRERRFIVNLHCKKSWRMTQYSSIRGREHFFDHVNPTSFDYEDGNISKRSGTQRNFPTDFRSHAKEFSANFPTAFRRKKGIKIFFWLSDRICFYQQCQSYLCTGDRHYVPYTLLLIS